MCEAAKILVPLTRFMVNWTPGVLSLEYYHQLFDTRLSFWMNNPCHLQILQITRSCPFMSLALVAFKRQACSETYEYRNTFPSCRHLSTSIYNRLKSIISGKPFSFTNFLVSSFLRIMFMRLYFRIMFFTSHYCLCSFIINYLISYFVFISCSSYFPKLKGPESMGCNFLPEKGHSRSFSNHSDSTEAESLWSKPPGNTMNSNISVPWIPLGRNSESWFLPWLWFSPKCWHRTRQKPRIHRTQTELFLFWRNEKPPHWDGICDIVSCPVHTSVLADQGEWVFVFKLHRQRIKDFMFAQHLRVPSTILKQDAVCLSFLFLACLSCDIGTSFARRIF